MLFENKEMLCKKENDGSTPSGPKDWYGPDGADFKTAEELENLPK